MDRNEIRRQIRKLRRALGEQERRERNQALIRHLVRSSLFRRARTIAFYLPNDGEVDLTPVIERARTMGKQCFLPVLSPTFHNRLWFAPYGKETRLAPNCFRIPEPVTRWSKTRSVRTIDLVLTPLVAFDTEGNRLGMGGGFYDRTLAYLRQRLAWHKPALIGVAYEFQRVPSLPFEPWDVPLHGVVTDAGFYRFSQRNRVLFHACRSNHPNLTN